MMFLILYQENNVIQRGVLIVILITRQWVYTLPGCYEAE